ncbi:ABC transporter permease [Spiroplasma chrysopicola]|uniref:Putative ABC transporter n=1 Tax=Spiroplasma chrysopicola DF-1 TaxID=1276227 RepID=R4U9S1_9MOLU|nr:ABC transporter permease [Spiroplasma chrysopicola]AGM24614.1 putative ABC transporter [Spiroplasma chrysopicola DF-1]
MKNKPKFFIVLKTEFKEKIYKNRLQVIKFLIICFIPFLYGFICSWAFWDPLASVSNIPLAIVNKDDAPCINYVVKKNGPDEQNLLTSPKINYSNTQSAAGCQSNGEQWFAGLGIGEDYQLQTRFESMIDLAIKNNDWYNPTTESLEIEQGEMKINLQYLANEKANFSPNDKYWGQLNISSGYTEHTFKTLRLLEHFKDEPSGKDSLKVELQYLINNKPDFWTTYKQNFLAGQVLYTFTQIKTALIHDTLPTVLAPSLFWLFAKLDNEGNYYIQGKDFENYLFNIVDILNPNRDVGKIILDLTQIFAPDLYDTVKDVLTFLSIQGQAIVTNYLQEIFPDLEAHISWNEYNTKMKESIASWNDLSQGIFEIPTHIQGYQFGKYGIGLGEFFIVIAMWVGVLMQTFIFDRAARTKFTTGVQHYFSKLILMLATTVIQTVILGISLAILGFSVLGWGGFLAFFVWLIFSSLIFTVIEHAIWFAPKDGDVGKFIIVLYLILNLTAGWGTFPSFLQADFFNTLSVITPFKYVVHGMGDIIYGISTGEGNLWQYQKEILINSGILLIWIPVLIIISLGLTTLWRKEELFGTINNKKIKTSLEKLNLVASHYGTNYLLRNLTDQELEKLEKNVWQLNEKEFNAKNKAKINHLVVKYNETNKQKYQKQIEKLKAKKFVGIEKNEDRDSIL